MNYQETLDYLFSQLPMFHRIGAAAYKADLNNTIAICNSLNNPQHNFKSIHIAGTNGKGSTSHMLAAILQTAGFKTGLYTSPHLKDFRERIRINGEMIAEKKVIDFVENYSKLFEEIKPSFFEWTVGLAYEFFSEEKVDFAVIETGLGGRLDSTNIITPLLSIITNISFDHKELLGDTLQKIAVEKAGIIKPNIPVVIGETQSETKNVFIQKSKEQTAPIVFAEENFNVIEKNYSGLQQTLTVTAENKSQDYILDLSGKYQQKNICTVLAAITELRKQNFNITDEQIQQALSNTKKVTGLRGRWEILNARPLTIADVGHNEAGINEVMEQIHSLKKETVHFVLGMVGDKERKNILQLLAKNFNYYFCKPSIPRGLDENILFEEATAIGLKGKYFDSVQLAYAEAKKNAAENDLIFIGGSTFVVAEII